MPDPGTGVHHSANGTLVGAAVTTITLAHTTTTVDVYNRGATELFVRTDGIDPTVAGADCFVVEPNSVRTFTGHITVVKLISSGTPAFEVSY